MALKTPEKPTHLFTVICLLGIIGLIPFIISVGCMLSGAWLSGGLQSASIFGLYAPYVFLAYSAIILSFLAGTLWGKWETFPSNRHSAAVLIFTNLTSLLAWVSLTVIHISQFLSILAVALLAAGYLGILGVERTLKSSSRGYWNLRVSLTTFVVFLHWITLYLMIDEL
jgi:hypothetical protein